MKEWNETRGEHDSGAVRNLLRRLLGSITKSMALSIHRRPGDDGHSIELIARRPRVEGPLRTFSRRVDSSFRAFMRMARMGKHARPKPVPSARAFLQRCAVQVRYTKGGSVGKWYSHGSYIGRESKQRDEKGRALGFGSEEGAVPIAAAVAGWRKEGDEILFRVILSPERGDRMDLEAHTREVMASAERDLGTKLEWVAVSHYNTDNPHVHVVVRGRREDGSTLFIPRRYVQEGFRRRAEESATGQLGYRQESDLLDVQRREISQMRYTGLDRKLKDRAVFEGGRWRVSVGQPPSARPLDTATELHLRLRLETLRRIGVARQQGHEWLIDGDFEKSLRTMQKTHDRIKITAEHGVLASDRRLPFRVLRASEIGELEGRVLVTGQEESSGWNYVLIESVRGEVVQIPQVREFVEARKRGQLPAGAYARIRARQEAEKLRFDVADLGDANALLADSQFLQANAAHLAATMPDGWSGWLGELRRASRAAAEQQNRNFSLGLS
jgi:type IV secretory pathway VirD2 relaxase